MDKLEQIFNEKPETRFDRAEYNKNGPETKQVRPKSSKRY